MKKEKNNKNINKAQLGSPRVRSIVNLTIDRLIYHSLSRHGVSSALCALLFCTLCELDLLTNRVRSFVGNWSDQVTNFPYLLIMFNDLINLQVDVGGPKEKKN